MTEPLSRRVKPTSMGWLRRPELDWPGIDIWEMPDGTLVASEKGKVLEITLLTKIDWPKP